MVSTKSSGRYFAHSLQGAPEDRWQPLADHLRAVAKLAEERGEKFGAGRAAALAGLLHDLGKYTQGFQSRLWGGAKVDHATAGAQEVRGLVRAGADAGMAELIAYGIAGHHAGLPDKMGGERSLAARWEKLIEAPDPIWRSEINSDASNLLPPGFAAHPTDRKRIPFQYSLLARMIFSTLVDADFRDTEAFYAVAEGRTPAREWPTLAARVDGMLAALDKHMAGKGKEGPVNLLRGQVLSHVRGQATLPQGLFSLTVPTGGGKTMTSLAFALAHAQAHGLDRIIYGIPFTSIIDQTAADFRDVLGDDMVLEHHSAIDEDELSESEAKEKLRLAMEDWAAPIVVTTNVQLFESLFANRPSRCRKLHNLARSVIVLDEAQTIPLPVLRPCVAVLDELARNYATSIVLCTATQPALSEPDFEGGFAAGAVRELAPDPQDLHRRLKRVAVRHGGVMTDTDLLDALAATEKGMVIVNSRAHALALYRQAQDAGLAGAIHLTTRQYAAHRRNILDVIRGKLASEEPCRLVATSLVEAGVDLDFHRVWRMEAGLDSIAQAAGRCNREGRRDPRQSKVTVFKAAEHKGARELQQLAGDMARIAGRHEDMLSLEAIRDYFAEVYWRKGTSLDKHGVLAAFKADRTGTDFAFRTVAEKFRLIESGLAPVIIARDEPARRELARLDHAETRAGRIARKLQPYTVQIPPAARALLLANGHVKFRGKADFGDQFAELINEHLYKCATGLLWEDAAYLSLENQIL